jgi:hypothetical protein
MTTTKTVNVSDGQNIIDVAIQEYGSLERVVKLCVDNALTVDQVLNSATSMIIDKAFIQSERIGIVTYLQKQGLRINSQSRVVVVEILGDRFLREDSGYMLREDGGFILREI